LSRPLRFPGRLSEGRACRVRCATLDYPFHDRGHDERAPPITGGTCFPGRLSEGRDSPVRCAILDYPLQFRGHDERAPPILAEPASQAVSRRDLLVRSAAPRWTIRSTSAGTTSVPLRYWRNLLPRPSLGGTRLSRPLRHVGLSVPPRRARRACPSDNWRNLLVRSGAIRTRFAAAQ
jgi:hypothetical protein